MKQLFTRKLMLLTAMLLAGLGSSFAFEYGGLTYQLIDNIAKTVRVTYQGSEPYTQSSIVIPSTVPFNGNNYTVVEIGNGAFAGAALSSITIPTSVKTIESSAFSGCLNLTSLDLSTIENFGSGILSGCKALTSVVLPNSMEYIPAGLLSGCSSITSFTFPSGVTKIGGSAFQGTGLTSINIPETVTEIGGSAFQNTGLTSINIPENVTKIGKDAFGGTSLTSVTTSASIIESGAFADCPNLTKVTLWGGGWYLSDLIFYGSDNIKTIICLARVEGSLGFSNNVKENATVIVPESQLANWSSFMNVEIANISNVGGHVIDVLDDGRVVPGGFISINGKKADGLYGQAFVIAPGTDVVVEFTPNYYEGTVLETATINGTDVTTSIVDDKYTITSISDNQLVEATWKKGTYYNVTTTYNNCNVFINGSQINTDINKYPANKDVSVLITPKTGYGISSFTINSNDKKSDLVDNGDGSYSYTFNLSSDTNINIQCGQKWSLTTTFNIGGTVKIGGETVASGTSKDMAGSTTMVEIYANSGYIISSILYNNNELLTGNTAMWSFQPASDKGINQTLDVTFTMVNPTISANYDKKKGSVSVAGSQLTPGMSQSFTMGSNVTFTVTPFLGYQIKQVTLDGVTDITASVIANSNSYTINNINDNHSIDVMFEAAPTPVSITATIGTLGMATLYSPYPLDFSDVVGLKAYILSAFTPTSNSTILTQIKDVPAKTGVVLIGNAGNYTVPTTTTKTYVANLLRGTDHDITMKSSDGIYTNYILANGSKGLGFYVIADGTTLAAGKAYLALPNNALAPAPSFVIMTLDSNDVTGIMSIENSTTDMPVYNLNGQRQDGLKKGINIVGGKKIVVK